MPVVPPRLIENRDLAAGHIPAVDIRALPDSGWDGGEGGYVEHNRRIHSELRDLGLLPPVGQNLPAHEINEYLRSGGSIDRDD